MIKYLNKDQIPYLKTEPLHIVFRSKALVGAVAGGFYDWSVNTLAAQPTPNGRVTASPRADLDPANLYVIESFTFSADIGQDDYSGAIIDNTSAPDVTPGLPRFHLYVLSEGTSPILTQPIPVPQYYPESVFPKWRLYSKEASDVNIPNGTGFLAFKNTNQFQGAFEGRLVQTPALIGKQSITLILALNVLEIRDQAFIQAYRAETEKNWG